MILKFITTGSAFTLHYEMPLAEVVTDFFDQMKKPHQGLCLDGIQPDRLPQEEKLCASMWLIEFAEKAESAHHDSCTCKRPTKRGQGVVEKTQGNLNPAPTIQDSDPGLEFGRPASSPVKKHQRVPQGLCWPSCYGVTSPARRNCFSEAGQGARSA